MLKTDPLPAKSFSNLLTKSWGGSLGFKSGKIQTLAINVKSFWKIAKFIQKFLMLKCWEPFPYRWKLRINLLSTQRSFHGNWGKKNSVEYNSFAQSYFQILQESPLSLG